jgi:histidyl-tRNA synthetase
MCRRRPSHSAQFNQLGVEFVGSDSVADDVEAIACAHSVLSSIGCTPPPRLLINSLGTPNDRARYRQHLAAHFAAHTCALSRDSVQRLQRGAVLRVLDSKDAADAAAISSAPCMSASLSRDSELRLQAVLHGLRLLRVPFTVDRRLVRGLDYYTSTAFEFVVGDGRACNAVLAGGRYDLGPQLQRASVPAIGWALGVDRFLALLPPPPPPHRHRHRRPRLFCCRCRPIFCCRCRPIFCCRCRPIFCCRCRPIFCCRCRPIFCGSGQRVARRAAGGAAPVRAPETAGHTNCAGLRRK